MGMGEPLLNYSNMLESVNKFAELLGWDVSLNVLQAELRLELQRQLRGTGDDGVKFNLALNLHTANDEKRSEIMAINDKTPTGFSPKPCNISTKKRGRNV